jgi:hypothetical protein
MLALTSPTSGVRSVDIARSRTQITELLMTEYLQAALISLISAGVVVSGLFLQKVLDSRLAMVDGTIFPGSL